MRSSPRSRPSIVWLTIILGVFLILPALSLGQSRSASSFSTPQNGVSSQNNLTLTNSVTSQDAFTLNSQPSLNQPIGTSPLTYHNGLVEHEEYVYAIFWLPPGYHYEPSGSDAIFESLIARYFSDVGGSNLTQLLVQYPDEINASPTSNVIFGGDFVDTSPYPHAGTTAAPLLGQDVTNEIDKVISSGSLPQGVDDSYFVFTANGINVCEDQAMTMCTFATSAQPGRILCVSFHPSIWRSDAVLAITRRPERNCRRMPDSLGRNRRVPQFRQSGRFRNQSGIATAGRHAD